MGDVETSIKILTLLRLVFVVAYLKCPWIVRGLVYLDAAIRLLESCLPIEWVQARNTVMALMIIDIVSNYCGSFYSNIVLLNVQFPAMTMLGCYVMKRCDVQDALIETVPYLVFLNLFYIAYATYCGRNTLIFGQYQHLNRYMFKFMYNLKEGIVTYHSNSKQVSFMNKSALNMLTDKSIKMTDDQQAANFSHFLDVSSMMFKRVTINRDQLTQAS